jgi:AraC-like DNA-binding protein
MAYLDVQFPTPDGRFVTRVETAIRRTLGTDSCNRNGVARAMAIHPRTLHRRLEREGETFDQIRDRVRREMAEYYLCKTNAPLSQVASIIGYSEQAVLSRSCQRWFGQTPRKFRAAHSA